MKARGALRAKCGEAWPASREEAGRASERDATRANTILIVLRVEIRCSCRKEDQLLRGGYELYECRR